MPESTKKLVADVLITADELITMDADYAYYAPGAIAISGDSIVAVGDLDELVASTAPEDRINLGKTILMPGLVNVHGHVPMTLLRNLADDLRLDVWLMGYMMPVEAAFVNPHFAWLGTQLAAAEMIRCGTTTFMDMYYYEEAVADATQQAGLRGVLCQSILRYPTPDAASYESGLARTRDFITRWKDHPLVIPGIAPHAPYTATPEMLQESVSLALELDAPLHIHVAETAGEVENHVKQYGMPVVPWLKKLGVFETKATLAHCVHLDEGEMRTLLHHNVGVAHNPSSNTKLASGIAPIKRMLDIGLNVGVGTDGPASNNDLDMLEEIRLTSFLAKVSTMDPTALPARQVVEMATMMGAKAMHIEDISGSLEVGKRADIIAISMDDARHTPIFQRDPDNVYSRIVYAAHQEDVSDVMVNGQWLMRDRELLTVDVAARIKEAKPLAKKIDKFLIRREESVLSKLVAISEVDQIKTFEVQVKVMDGELQALEDKLHALPEVRFQRGTLRHQYDTYFIFHDQYGSRLRFREDEVRDLESGDVIDVISRLTLTSEAKEREFDNSIVLSRSRFDASATRSLRFYQEYFRPDAVVEVHKERRRFHIRYGGTDFALNFDSINKPSDGGVYLEIKSRTWSQQDAERKAQLIGDLLKALGIEPDALVKSEYLELAQE